MILNSAFLYSQGYVQEKNKQNRAFNQSKFLFFSNILHLTNNNEFLKPSEQHLILIHLD